MDLDSDCFKCPISKDIMEDPVLASDGFSYERVYIQTWIMTKGKISPMTREPIKERLIPNRALNGVMEWIREKEKEKEYEEKEKEKEDLPDCMKRELLSKLSEDNNFIVLEKLLKEGIFGEDIEYLSEQAVIACLWKNHPSSLEVLVKYGAKIEWETVYPFLHKINKDYHKLQRICEIGDEL